MSLPARVKKNAYISRRMSDKIYDKLRLNSKKIDRKEFHLGMNIELEHHDITHGDLIKTAKITLAHLRELSDYNSRLNSMEKYAKRALEEKRLERIKSARQKRFRTLLFDDVDDED